jgi:diguanylate cyclase (GGDEF)-like protein
LWEFMNAQLAPNINGSKKSYGNGFTPGSLTLRYIFALSLIAILVIAAQILVQYSLSHQENDSRIINIAGRQRLLTQSMRKASLMILTAPSNTVRFEGLSDIKSSFEQWSEGHDFLLSSGKQIHGNPQKVFLLFEEAEPHRLAIQESARLLIAAMDQGAEPDLLAEAAATIIHHGSPMLRILDRVVAAYEQDARQGVRQLRQVEIVLTVIMLGVLALEALFIFRPAVLRIKRDMSRLREASNQLWLLSQHDGLTGVPNRRSFDDKLDEEWGRAVRERQSLALIMLDIDHFKLFNDHHGHLAGDDALRRVAQATQDQLKRPGDFLARYGGEEFGLVLPDTGLEGALLIAERIRWGVETLGIKHRTFPAGEKVTVSLGVAAEWPKVNGNPDDLLRAADQALYAAKLAGRNQVRSAEQPGLVAQALAI